MSIENAVARFIENQINSATPDKEISGAILHEDTYEEIGAGSKWIRVDIMTASLPQPKPDNSGVKEYNAKIAVQFIARPATQTKEDRREARRIASDMANEIALTILQIPNLGDATNSICDCVVRNKINLWHNVGTNRVAASYLILEMNL